MVTVIEENNDAKESGLAHLCEFIEDCEHTTLATKILHLLGQEGPRTTHPSKYIRFIYNRVILENAEVRAGMFHFFPNYPNMELQRVEKQVSLTGIISFLSNCFVILFHESSGCHFIGEVWCSL